MSDELHTWEGRIHSTLQRAWGDHGWVPVTDDTPLEELMNAEPEWDLDPEPAAAEWAWPSSEQPDVILSHLKLEEARQIAAWARRQQVRWLAGDGIHPFRVVQRFYALCWKCYRELTGPLSGADLASMLGQGRAAFQAVMRRLFDDPARLIIGQAVKVEGQKPEASREAYAKNAAQHCPRRMLGSKDGAGLSEGERKGRRAGLTADHARRLKEAREAAERRELERDAAEFERMVRATKGPEGIEGRVQAKAI